MLLQALLAAEGLLLCLHPLSLEQKKKKAEQVRWKVEQQNAGRNEEGGRNNLPVLMAGGWSADANRGRSVHLESSTPTEPIKQLHQV